MSFPLPRGPVLVWFPAGRSIDFAFRSGNQVVYVIVSAAASMGDAGKRGISAALLQLGVDLVSVEAQEPA